MIISNNKDLNNKQKKHCSSGMSYVCIRERERERNILKVLCNTETIKPEIMMAIINKEKK